MRGILSKISWSNQGIRITRDNKENLILEDDENSKSQIFFVIKKISHQKILIIKPISNKIGKFFGKLIISGVIYSPKEKGCKYGEQVQE